MQIVKVTEKIVKHKSSARIVYEHTYEDGSKVVTFLLDAQRLHHGGADFLGGPVYCHPCRAPRAHVYYQRLEEARCLSCGNQLGENDTRPLARVLAFPSAPGGLREK